MRRVTNATLDLLSEQEASHAEDNMFHLARLCEDETTGGNQNGRMACR